MIYLNVFLNTVLRQSSGVGMVLNSKIPNWWTKRSVMETLWSDALNFYFLFEVSARYEWDEKMCHELLVQVVVVVAKGHQLLNDGRLCALENASSKMSLTFNKYLCALNQWHHWEKYAKWKIYKIAFHYSRHQLLFDYSRVFLNALNGTFTERKWKGNFFPESFIW